MMGENEGFEPVVVGFVCASSGVWTSKVVTGRKAPPDPGLRMEIYPVDCVGAIPTFLLQEALEKGADGVLMVTCGDGLCHYFDGEARLSTRLEMVRTLVEDMGMEPERIVLRKVSDRNAAVLEEGLEELLRAVRSLGPSPFRSDGAPKVPRGIGIWPGTPAMTGGPSKEVEAYARGTGVVQCLECGKCTASCPISRFKSDFSPMYLIEKALRAPKPEVDRTADYWTCLTCANCSEHCPSNVDFVDFVRFLRERVDVKGGICTHGGTLQSVWRHQAGGGAQDRMSWVTHDLEVSSDKGEVLYFVGCMPYFDVLFDQIGFKGAHEIAARTVGLMNMADIRPVVMPDERCCGHDAYYGGDMEVFRALVELNTKAIKATGAKRMVLTCPEGFHVFKDIYPRFTDLDIEVVHITELLAELIDGRRILLPDVATETFPVTYHDPCRLARFSKVMDAPRKLLTSTPVLELHEMERRRELSTCCGTSAWLNCNAISEQVRADRLRQAQATGALTMVTACPKCQIHFKCTQSAKPGERGVDPRLRVVDIVTLISELARGGR